MKFCRKNISIVTNNFGESYLYFQLTYLIVFQRKFVSLNTMILFYFNNFYIHLYTTKWKTIISTAGTF